MPKVGIISANWGAVAHLPAWRALPGVEVTAICTSRQETAEAAAERFGFPRAFWNAEEMIADPDIDIIDIGTRPSIRHSMVLAALAAKKHIYNGIPFSADVDRARALHRAWKGSESVAIVDAYSQWLPAPRMAKRMIDDGFLGQPFGGNCIFNLGLFNTPHPAFPYNWFAEGGHGVSAMRNLGSHMLHMLVSLLGEVDEVMADDSQLLKEWRFPDGSTVTPQNNDYANLLVRFRTGMLLQVQISWSATVGRGFHVDLFGSGGRMVMSAPSFPTSLGTTLHAGKLGERTIEPVEIPDELMRPEGIDIAPNVPVEASHGMAISMQNMVRAIEGTATPAPDFGQAWAVERVLEAARRSSESRRWVKVDDVD
ncbi:Gfo/Idh/MocA family protein [Stakelama tenebrarum]|uniref:Gfo/Idh/MocA family oxidoreductase n=1 Tax=Stakelama tenebrarum TaxID=2711215 RepID=A0A6G6Y7E3_9SPHN|nr:Gfo/Idh/MocA family oxidoreductase [Sphingosinithalassobacter tenebrarum]QIG80717.1 Gfo/Idh/MocA family oxidoreductase [Sphingosinithalassobacter tenebrarum]